LIENRDAFRGRILPFATDFWCWPRREPDLARERNAGGWERTD
jgi:hypothetical protein